MKLKITIASYVLLLSLFTSFPKNDNADFVQQDSLKESMIRGQALYKTCAACHNKKGEGYAKISPPLAKSDYLESREAEEIIRIVKFGLQGEIVVNGETYNGNMPAQPFDERQIADVLNYVRNSFGNTGAYISKEDVEVVKKM